MATEWTQQAGMDSPTDTDNVTPPASPASDTTWEQRAGMTSPTDTDNLESYAEQAEASKDAAAASEAAAAASAAAAAASEVEAESAEANAAASATTATTGAATATTKASEAAASATSASTSASAAQTAQTAAEAAETAASASETASSASAAAASTSETNAATSASAASTSETNAATSASAASASETNAATSASAASTSATAAQTAQTAAELAETNAETAETNAAASATSANASALAALASEIAAGSSETNAATSESNAASSASAASTSETNAAASEAAASTSEANAATSETNAANSATASATSATASAGSATASASSATAAAASETAAATSEGNAATSASNAATSAANAATSETNASTSATAAASSASSASASADAALAALDSFDDRYLGQKASDPTLDNDGNPLVAGALYFNTTDDIMKVYDGAAWLAAYASLSGALLATNNLSDVLDAATARTNLGLGTAATTGSTDYATAAQGALADSAVQTGDSPSFVNVTVSGTVDGRDVAADGSKLDGIEAGATADQTAGEIKTAYESNANTNAYTDAEKSKLAGIEAGADVTDTANVTAAGALMDSEVTNLAQVKAFSSADYATAAQGALADSALQSGDNVSALTNDAGYTTNVGDITGVTAGTGLSGGGASGSVTLNVDLSELTDMTAAMIGTDEFIVLDAGADRRKAANEIGLSIFSNDAGFTANVGDITGVTAGTGLSGGGTSGSVTLSHADTSTLSGTYGSTADGTKIDQITVDANGHVTAITTGATGDIQGVTAGSGITGGGTSGTVTVSHADTSSQGSVNNSGTTVIQDITLDTYGHITALGSTTLSIPAAYTNSDVDTHLNTSTATADQVLSWTGTDYDWINAAGGSAGSIQVWLNLNGRSFGIVADGNISSAVDQGTGQYLINYSSAVSSSSYQVAGTAYGGATNGTYGLTINAAYTPLSRTTSSLEFDTERTSTFAREDTADINIAVIL